MQFYNNKPIRLIELFAGIGSQAKAMKNLGLDFEHWFVCEFDKYAVQSYNSVHGTNVTTSDVTKITANDLKISDTENFTYLLTYSFPCQDLSNAGKGAGMAKGSGTRSGLLWEVERLLNECTELPQVLLMENVPQVHNTKNKEHFDKWIEFLTSKGYSNHWADLNAKDFGIPQNRNRCYMISILGDYSFEFPKGFPLEMRLKDILEETVDEKYYLNAKQLSYAIDLHDVQKGTKWEGRCDNGKLNPNIASTLGVRSAGGHQRIGVSNFVVDGTDEEMTAAGYKKYVRQIGQLYDIKSNPQSGRIYDVNGICPTMDTCSGGNRMPKVAEPKVIGGIGEKKSNGGRQWYQQDRIYDDGIAISVTTAFNPYYATTEPKPASKLMDEIESSGILNESINEPKIIQKFGDRGTSQFSLRDYAHTIPANPMSDRGQMLVEPTIREEPQSLRIRKLTPKECWRLMGFDDADVEKAAKVCSNAQLYKQAGNSIVVNVLMAIFKELFIPKKTRSQWLDELLGGEL